MRSLIIIPTYNERESLPTVMDRLRRAVPQGDVLVVDDNSPDGTGEMADRMAEADGQIHVLHTGPEVIELGQVVVQLGVVRRAPDRLAGQREAAGAFLAGRREAAEASLAGRREAVQGPSGAHPGPIRGLSGIQKASRLSLVQKSNLARP